MLAIVSIAPAAAQTIKEGAAVVVTSKGESKPGGKATIPVKSEPSSVRKSKPVAVTGSYH